MTAIAYRDGVLAADTLVAAGIYRCGYARKIGRSPDGTLGAAAGSASDSHTFLRELEDGKVADLDFTAMDEHFTALIIMPDGAVWTADSRGLHTFEAPYYAEGSAHAFLNGAMAAGVSAVEAVRLAIEHMDSVGGTIDILHLGETQPVR